MSEIEAVAVDPTTGEVLVLEELRERLDALDERMAPLFRERRWLREAVAELAEPAPVPRARDRTERQERVTLCPRCGTRIKEEV